MQQKKQKGRLIPLFLLIVSTLVFLYFLEEITPIKYISDLKTQNLLKKDFPFIEKEIVFGVLVDNNPKSLISREDLKSLKEKNSILFLDKNSPAYFEGKYNGKYVFILEDTKCKAIFSIENQKTGFFSKIRDLKFLLFYNIDKETAFYYKYKNIDKSVIFTNFNPIKDICFTAKNEGLIKEKYIKSAQKFTFPDINYQLKLIRNILYIKKELDSFYKKKKQYLNAINKGNSYAFFYKNPDIEFFVKTKRNYYTFGDLIKISENPVMYFYTNPKYIIAVYINGKLENYYKGSFFKAPKSAGYYQFVVFDYKYNLFNLFFGFDIIAITNPVYFE